MDIKVLKSSILSVNVPSFLIFVNEEQALAKQYIETMANTLGKAPKYYFDVNTVIRDLEDNSESVASTHLNIIYDSSICSNFEKYMNYFTNNLANNQNVIILLPSIDKRTEFYKKYKNYFVIFEKLDKYTILAYALKLCKKNKCSINQESLLDFIEKCDCDLGIILNELDKIFILGQENSNVVFDYMQNNGFSDYRKINVYNFINRVLDFDLNTLKDMYKVDDSPVGILTLLYNNARKRLVDSGNNKYVRVMIVCNRVCQGIVDATIDSKYALKYALLEIFR